MEEFSDDDFIICPYCEKIIKDAWDYGLGRYYDVIECPHCEKEFEARVETSYVYYSRAIGVNDDC
jgi:uncharacterized C2H2 Zn-finger protein